MRVEAVSVGREEQAWLDQDVSERYQRPLHGLIAIGKHGLEGDIAHKLHADDTDKAVFVMPAQVYEHLHIREPFGFLGENLTISGLDEYAVCLGDRLRIGTVLLEVSQPRVPCWKKEQRTATRLTPQHDGCIGFYCRVLQEGLLHKGDAVVLTPYEETLGRSFSRVTVYDLHHAKLYHASEKEWLTLQSVVKHPALSANWRKAIIELLKVHEQFLS